MTAPRATYRLQLHAGFTFADAAAARAVPRRARHQPSLPVADPAGRAGHDARLRRRRSRARERRARRRGGLRARWSAPRARHGLGILLDIVPNHMSIAGTGNRWWWDVLENGPASCYAHFFDVDWARAATTACCCRCSASTTAACSTPASSRSCATARRVRGARAASTRCRSRRASLGRLVRRAGERDRHRRARVPRRRARARCRATARRASAPPPPPRQGGAARRGSPSCARAGVRGRDRRRGRGDQRRSRRARRAARAPELPARALARRRRASSTTAASSTSTRWSALRVEDPDVFDASHARDARAGSRDGAIDGVRIDHVDGLRDPERLPRRGCASARPTRGSWSRRSSAPSERAARELAGRRHDRLRVR